MKIFVSYIKTNVLWVVFCAVLILFQMVFMRLSGMKQNDCIYGIILESMVFIVVFFIGFINYLIKYNKLKRTSMLDIDEQSDMPETSECVEQLYQEIIENQIISRKEIKADKDKADSEMLQYYGMWVHQIKTPIAAMRLLLQTDISEFAADNKNKSEENINAAGLGKTHLMHAIANYILEHDKTKKVVYVTSETFTNEIVDAVRDSKNEHSTARQDFRNKYRTVDVLLIDDIQFIEGKEATQLEFFHTFNHLHGLGKQIIISSDKHPSTMTTLEERLRSRFEMGLTVDIKTPTYETRMAILRKKVIEENIAIDDSILDYIASNIISNIRELQGAINKVISFSNLCGKEVTMELAKEALSDMINPNMKRQITIDYITETVADHFGITVKDLMSTKRNSNIAFPRHICMYLCRQLTSSPLAEIGNKLGNRHHSTILHGIEIIEKKLNDPDNNEDLIKTLDVLNKKIDPQ